MDFTVEQHAFPSAVHENIYWKARSIPPLSRTHEAVDPALRESCAALHGFVMAMLADMYIDPGAYHLPAGKLEEFLGGRSVHEVKREQPARFKTLYGQASHGVSQYMHLLFWLGYGGSVEGGAVLVSAEMLQNIARRVSTSVSPIKLEKRMEALGRAGLVMETPPSGGARFTSRDYPGMFPALAALAGSKGFEFFDFRAVGGAWKPGHDEFFAPLFAAQREVAYAVHDFAMQRKMRVTLNANWGVLYHLKGRHIMTIKTGDDIGRFLSVNVVAKDKTDVVEVVGERLGREPPELRELALNRLSGCDANRCLNCSTFASGRYVTILDRRHQMCGEGVIRYDWRDPAPADIAAIKRLIAVRCEVIDEALTANKG